MVFVDSTLKSLRNSRKMKEKKLNFRNCQEQSNYLIKKNGIKIMEIDDWGWELPSGESSPRVVNAFVPPKIPWPFNIFSVCDFRMSTLRRENSGCNYRILCWYSMGLLTLLFLLLAISTATSTFPIQLDMKTIEHDYGINTFGSFPDSPKMHFPRLLHAIVPWYSFSILLSLVLI